MSRVNLVFAAVLLIMGTAVTTRSPAFEYGLNLDNRTELRHAGTENGFSYTQNDVARLWLRLHPSSAFRLDLQGAAGFEPGEEPFPDLEVLSLSGNLGFAGGALSYELGRTVLSLGEGLVLNHPADVAVLRYGRQFDLRLGAGYFGLLRKESVSLLGSRNDLLDSEDDDIFFAPQRAVSFLELGFPALRGSNRVSLAYVRQDDLRDSSDEETLDTQYLSLVLQGPLVASLYYRVLGVGGLLDNRNRESEPRSLDGHFYFAEVLLEWYPGEVSRLATSLRYGSGEDGDTRSYTPISSPPNGTVFRPGLGNILKVSMGLDRRLFAAASEEALHGFAAGLELAAYLRPTEAPIREQGLAPAAGAGYLGTEGLLRLTFRPFSDVGMTTTTGVFVPRRGSGGFEKDDRGVVQWMTRLEFSLAL